MIFEETYPEELKKIVDRDFNPIHQERLLKWVEALESGKYQQGQGNLLMVESWNDDGSRSESYCCLGVATRVAVENGLDLAGALLALDASRNAHDPDPVGRQYAIRHDEILTVTNDVSDRRLYPEAFPYPYVLEWYGLQLQNPIVAVLDHEPSGDENEQGTWGFWRDERDGKSYWFLTATEANDEVCWSFMEIAESVREIYQLGPRRATSAE